MLLLPYWKPISIALLCLGMGYMGWHERDIRADAEIATYKASVAQAQAKFEKENAQTVIAQASITTKSEQDHAQAITDLNAYWADILRKRTASGGGKVPSVPAAPTSIDGIPAVCLSFAQQSAQTAQQLTDLQQWIRNQETSQTYTPQR